MYLTIFHIFIKNNLTIHRFPHCIAITQYATYIHMYVEVNSIFTGQIFIFSPFCAILICSLAIYNYILATEGVHYHRYRVNACWYYQTYQGYVKFHSTYYTIKFQALINRVTLSFHYIIVKVHTYVVSAYLSILFKSQCLLYQLAIIIRHVYTMLQNECYQSYYEH